RMDGPEPRLWIVPSAHTLDDAALAALLDRVRASGSTLLITGPLSLDAYWGPTERMADILGRTRLENVLREEVLDVDGRTVPVSFGGDGIATLVKEVPVDGAVPALQRVPLGDGTLLWCPLPVELDE